MAKAKRPATPAQLAHLARLNADPEAKARALAGIRAKHANPAWKARVTAAVRVSKADPKVYTLENVKTGERRQGTRADFRRWYGIPLGSMQALIRGRSHTAMGWRLAPETPPPKSRPFGW